MIRAAECSRTSAAHWYGILQRKLLHWRASVDLTKTCTKCSETKLLSCFSPHTRTAGGYRGQCKKCRAAYTLDYRRRTGYKAPNWGHKPGSQAETFRRWKISKRYGISVEQYDQMIADQGGVCAICKKPPTEYKYRLCVDHCHVTGRVRGVLCVACNTAIGLLGDNIGGVLSALQYLTAHTQPIS